jgi:hypothetical protein
MVTPTQHSQKDFLFEQATSRYVLHSAWMRVRPRLEKSKDEKIRADAAAFALNVPRSVSQLQSAIRNSSFVFEPQKGVLKKRNSEPGQPKKDPRPIVVAPAKNRIVQRAILDICQSEDAAIRRKLGGLVKVVQRPTSVGGLPDRGVPEALSLIKAAIREGATWYVRSDLKNFFQAVPKNEVLNFFTQNVKGSRFGQLFMDALSTELANAEEVREMLHLFPTGATGVPQGSALSALCANIVLSDFDTQFNIRGITTIRYLDDFVMLGKDKKSTLKAFRIAEALLLKSGFECHDPFNNTSKKAAAGEVSGGFEFLSFSIAPEKISPTRLACAEFLSGLDVAIADAKADIEVGLAKPRRSEPRYFQALVLLDKKIRGWGDAFRPTTERLIFSQLDKKVEERLRKFQGWYERRTKGLDEVQRRRSMGLALLADTPIPQN